MDARSFDTLSRQLAGARSRRNVFAAFGGALLAGFAVGTEASAKPAKVNICHLDDTGGWTLISVSTNAVPAHTRHGDVINPDFTSDPNNCGSCGHMCDPGATCDNGTCTAPPPVCVGLGVGCASDSDCCQVDAIGGAGTAVCHPSFFGGGNVCMDTAGSICDFSRPDLCTAGICQISGSPDGVHPICA